MLNEKQWRVLLAPDTATATAAAEAQTQAQAARPADRAASTTETAAEPADTEWAGVMKLIGKGEAKPEQRVADTAAPATDAAQLEQKTQGDTETQADVATAEEQAADTAAATTEKAETEKQPKAIEAMQKRIDKITRQREEAREELEETRGAVQALRKELDELKTNKAFNPVPQQSEPVKSPLETADTPEAIGRLVDEAQQVEAWALENLDGVEVPNPTDPNGEPVYYDAAKVRKYLAGAKRVLNEAPKRLEQIRLGAAILDEVKKVYPQTFDGESEDAALYGKVMEFLPFLKELPQGPMIVADSIAGMRARLAKHGKLGEKNGEQAARPADRAASTTQTAKAPLAPVPPTGSTGSPKPKSSDSLKLADAGKALVESRGENLKAFRNIFDALEEPAHAKAG